MAEATLLKQEMTFDQWKKRFNLQGANEDDLRTAYEAGIDPAKMPEAFKAPNHPEFTVDSMFWRPGMAGGRMEGGKYIPMDSATATRWVLAHGQKLPSAVRAAREAKKPVTKEPEKKSSILGTIWDMMGGKVE